jgi:L-aspartate oxidase
LWAVGEVASTGLHGANRLASNSLLEAVVLGARAAEDITGVIRPAAARPIAKTYHVASDGPMQAARRGELIQRLRRTMGEDVGVVRNARGLERALRVARDVGDEASGDGLVANMALAAELIAGSALLRKESRGAHFRSDYPEPVAAFAHRSAVTLADMRAMSTRCRSVEEADCGRELPL